MNARIRLAPNSYDKRYDQTIAPTISSVDLPLLYLYSLPLAEKPKIGEE